MIVILLLFLDFFYHVLKEEKKNKDWLDITSSDSVPILNQPFELNMSPTFDSQNQAFIWIYADESGQLFSLSLKFSGIDSSEPFRECFTKCMWETNARDSYDKVGVSDSFVF